MRVTESCKELRSEGPSHIREGFGGNGRPRCRDPRRWRDAMTSQGCNIESLYHRPPPSLKFEWANLSLPVAVLVRHLPPQPPYSESRLRVREYLIIEETNRPHGHSVTALCAVWGLIRRQSGRKGTYGEDMFTSAISAQYKNESSYFVMWTAIATGIAIDKVISATLFFF